jgi:two-component system sensor histidine kinase KdpD
MPSEKGTIKKKTSSRIRIPGMINDERPNPDELLVRVQEAESRAHRGRLRIFFGYAAGVGKTYSMLEAAQRERAEGVDVVVGYVEPHGRPETEALLAGLESISPRAIPYRGVTLREFDLDATLARRPQLVLVDELAHTNVEGSRHAKRWQDVEELLQAGMNVWTTLNVQHVESLNDVIAQITGIVVRETLPDAVLEKADEIELIDITPEELLERLQVGKVYIPPQAERAIQHFFQKTNLVALRELSLRQAAMRIQRDVDAARHERAARVPWATAERVLVCVGPSPTSARIIRSTKRLAASLGAEWLAVAVNPGVEGPRSAAIREQTARNLRLAERLGAEAQTLIGRNVAETVIQFAASRNVTKIVIGKTSQPRWKRALIGTIADHLLERAGDIDIYVVTGEGEAPAPAEVLAKAKPVPWTQYLIAGAVVALCGLVSWGVHATGLSEANVIMIFLIGVAIVSARYGRGPSILSVVASVLAFDFFFVPPFYTFAVADAQYVITFVVMLGIGLLISELTSRRQSQLRASQQQEHRTAQLYRMTRQLTELAGSEFLVRTAGRQLTEIFDGEVVIFLREPNGSLSLRYGENTSVAQQNVNTVVAQWVTTNNKSAGAGTDTLPNATALFAPMIGSQRTVGALGVRPKDESRLRDPDQQRLLETCASLIALSIERDESVLEAHQAQLQVESEQLRNSLLNSVSHDLRTPLATIAGAASSLVERSVGEEKELLQTVVDESRRLSRLVDNLLRMARLDAGAVTLNRQWHVLEEIVGVALGAMKRELAGHEVQVRIPADFPLISIDGFLMEQVFVNLLENAARYTPAGSRIEICASVTDKSTEIRFTDNGPGLPAGSESRIFDRFFRGSVEPADGRRGVGLGLAICQTIVRAHRGEVTAANRREGGAEFRVVLPREQPPPVVEAEADTVRAGA